MKIALHQMNSGINIQRNISDMTSAISVSAKNGAAMYFAPEMSVYLDRDRNRASTVIDEIDTQSILALQMAAKDNDIWVHMGSMPIKHIDAGGAPYANRSFIIDNQGQIRAQYDKIHLFDVKLSTGEEWRESSAYRAGDRVITLQGDIGKIGMSICYDLRFANLYNKLSEEGAEIAAVPAAFTVPTGKAHWHVLLRARAIENAMFIVAAAQCGKHQDGRETYGHSLVVDPWGEVLLDMGQDIGVGYADIDLDHIRNVRAQLPVLDHRRDLDRYT